MSIKKEISLDDLIPGSIFFRWREALWLPRWGVHCFPTSEEVYSNIVKTARIADIIRNRVGKPMSITSWLRPQNYNQWAPPYGVGGAQVSTHIQGMAIDFIVATIPSWEVREIIRPELERLKIRMENLDTPHVHVDCRDPGGGGRYFKP